MKVLGRQTTPALDLRVSTSWVALTKALRDWRVSRTFNAPRMHADFQSFLRLFPLQLPSSNVETSSSPSFLGSLANV